MSFFCFKYGSFSTNFGQCRYCIFTRSRVRPAAASFHFHATGTRIASGTTGAKTTTAWSPTTPKITTSVALTPAFLSDTRLVDRGKMVRQPPSAAPATIATFVAVASKPTTIASKPTADTV
jgi:hypothetical protein